MHRRNGESKRRSDGAGGIGGYNPIRWFRYGAVVLGIVVVLSTLIYHLLGIYYDRPDWTLKNCLFMVVITLTTIGYGDWLSLRGLTLAEFYTMGLAVVGMAVPAFVITNLTGLIVEGMFSHALRRKKMDKQIAQLQGHVILCGLGNTGLNCLNELLLTKRPCVIVDRDPAILAAAVREHGEFLSVTGDADADAVLQAAGIGRAFGLITCLPEDKDNLFVTLSARALNPKLRIVSKVEDAAARAKMLTAGADATVSPDAIGGLRMVSEMLRPSVVTFLDTMLRDRSGNYRFEELRVGAGSPAAGQTLGALNLRSLADVLAVGIRPPAEERFLYNPQADARLEAGAVLVLLGQVDEIGKVAPLFAATKD